VRLRLKSGTKIRTVKARPLTDSVVTFALPRIGAGSWKLTAKYSGDAQHKKARQVTTLKVIRKR